MDPRLRPVEGSQQKKTKDFIREKEIKGAREKPGTQCRQTKFRWVLQNRQLWKVKKWEEDRQGSGHAKGRLF